MRPDTLLYDKAGIIIAIEIVVTHPVSEEKKKLYEGADLKCLCIDLSYYNNKDFRVFQESIINDLLKGTGKKQWLWSDPKTFESGEILDIDKQENIPGNHKTNTTESGFIGIVAIIVGGLLLFKLGLE